MIKKKISIKDIARLTNTSITTVSFVLNGKGRISEPIKKIILEVAKEHGYEPNRMAVGLRTGRSKVIGLVVEEIGGEFFGALAKVIEQEAENAGYRIIYCSTNNNLKKGRDVIKMLSQQMVDGYIITPIKGLEQDILDIIGGGKPVVLIDSYYPDLDIPHVLVDNYISSFNGAEHLVQSGYRNIGFVSTDIDLIQLQERMQGFKDALAANDIKNDSMILKLPFKKDETQAIKSIKNFIKQNKTMDAIFFATNYLGILGLQSIKEMDLIVPKDLAIISFDDNIIFSLYPPGITTIQQPTYEIAKSAIDLLLSQLDSRQIDISKINLQIPSKIILRNSTSPLI
jgi:LacI family transcriptional regulator